MEEHGTFAARSGNTDRTERNTRRIQHMHMQVNTRDRHVVKRRCAYLDWLCAALRSLARQKFVHVDLCPVAPVGSTQGISWSQAWRSGDACQYFSPSAAFAFDQQTQPGTAQESLGACLLRGILSDPFLTRGLSCVLFPCS